jgi:hypothetical protein
MGRRESLERCGASLGCPGTANPRYVPARLRSSSNLPLPHVLWS